MLIHGDCLEEMKHIEDGSIDMVLTDPPYGTTACKWDAVVSLDLMWEQLKRIIKPNGAIVMTASQPFTTTLIASNMKMFKYEWIWEKSKATGHALCKKRPMKSHENILVFCGATETYAPQKTEGKPYKSPYSKKGNNYQEQQDMAFNTGSVRYDSKDGKRYPRTNIFFKNAYYEDGNHHPTQKPVALMEYLIKTYTNGGEIVLDFTMGSGTTGVACKRLNRNFIGIEKDKTYFNIAKERIGNA